MIPELKGKFSTKRKEERKKKQKKLQADQSGAKKKKWIICGKCPILMLQIYFFIRLCLINFFHFSLAFYSISGSLYRYYGSDMKRISKWIFPNKKKAIRMRTGWNCCVRTRTESLKWRNQWEVSAQHRIPVNQNEWIIGKRLKI